jgi:hypothetical protein
MMVIDDFSECSGIADIALHTTMPVLQADLAARMAGMCSFLAKLNVVCIS